MLTVGHFVKTIGSDRALVYVAELGAGLVAAFTEPPTGLALGAAVQVRLGFAGGTVRAESGAAATGQAVFPKFTLRHVAPGVEQYVVCENEQSEGRPLTVTATMTHFAASELQLPLPCDMVAKYEALL